MKRKHTLSAALALTLSACPLLAQDNQPTQPQRPAQPPQREGESRREGGRGGAEQRQAPGLFGALDANHDGAIDREELEHAMEVLRKFDRNSDGRILPDEMRPEGAGQRPPAGNEGRAPQTKDGGRRGPREPGKQAEGHRDQGTRPEGRGDEPRHEGARPGGDRTLRPEGEARRDGDRPHSEPQQGPRDGQRAPGESRGGDVKRESPQGPPPGDAAQAQHRDHRRGSEMRDGQNRFAQQPRPDFERGGQRPPWAPGAAGRDGGQQGPMAMGPRIDARHGPGQMPGREGLGQRGFRNELGARGPQGGPGQFQPHGPGPMQRPNFDGPKSGPQRPGPGDMRRPEGMRDGPGDRAPQGLRGDRDSRPQSPRPLDVQ